MLTVNPWLEGILGTLISALLVAVATGFWKGLNSLKENTRAITSLEKAITEIKTESQRTFEQANLRIADLETWRTAVTASLFRVATGSGHQE